MNVGERGGSERRSIYLVSLGCPKNWVDSEVMLGHLLQAGHRPVPDPHLSDVIVINTCAFIQEAKEEALETILEMAQWKGKGRCRWLVVTGCLPKRYGRRILDLLPEVDLMLGPGEVPRIAEHIQSLDGETPRECYSDESCYLYDHRAPRVLALPGPAAYVKIAEGCSNRCTYCAVPSIRGSLRSRTMDSVVEEVKELVAMGVKEVILVAQDTTAFGLDRSEAGELPALLGALDEIEDLLWIRLLYAHPAHVSDALIETLAGAQRICPYLDLPIQHINARLLRRMNRRIDSEGIRRVIQSLRRAIPGIYLRTSCIVGFPGETDDEFKELLDFVAETRFDWLGAFPYSSEENTPAARFEGALPIRTIQGRLDELMALQKPITQERLTESIGRDVGVLIESSGDGESTAVGRTAFQSPEIDGVVHISGKKIPSGFCERVRITDVRGYDLVGEIPENN